MKKLFIEQGQISVVIPVDDAQVTEVTKFIKEGRSLPNAPVMQLIESNIEVVMFKDTDSLEHKKEVLNRGNKLAPAGSYITGVPRKEGDVQALVMCPEEFQPIVESGQILKIIDYNNWDKLSLHYQSGLLHVVHTCDNDEEYWKWDGTELIEM